MMSVLHRITEARKAITLKTLRMTGIIAVASVAILFAVPALFGVHHDEKVEQFLNSPGAIEKFNKAKADKPAGSHEQISPLIKQAEAFALYLNPPAKREPKTTKPSRARREEPRPKGPVSSKFELIGTSYYELRPDLSLALIDEPGKGVNWVRQSGKVGHLIIEDIKDALVVVRDGKKTFELTCERPKKTSLVKKAPPLNTRITSKRIQQPAPPSKEHREEDAALEGIFAELQAVKRIIDSEEAYSALSAKEKTYIEDMFTELDAASITGEEAERLNRLGKELKEHWRKRNRAKGKEAESNTSASVPDLNQPQLFDTNLIEPNSPE
jgi:hypothetical protein